jgi:hypothetical protein
MLVAPGNSLALWILRYRRNARDDADLQPMKGPQS